jgi:hypothetical protein
MPSSEVRKPNYRRRFRWLIIFIVILFGGYSAAWFFVAGKLEGFASQAIASLNRDGTSADCVKPTARGFPFRIGLFCDSVRFEDAPNKVAASAAAFRSAAQVYDPFLIVAELDSPAKVSAPGAGEIGMNWGNLRASVRIDTDFPERVSAETDGLAVEAEGGGAKASLLSLGHGEAHMRKNGADLDLAANFSDAALDARITQGAKLPPLAAQADLTIKDGVDWVRFGGGSLRGRSGTVRTLALSTGENTGLALSGSFAVGEDGLLDADLTVTVRSPKQLAEQLAAAFPANADQIRTSFMGLAAMGDNPSMPLKVTRGKARLGFVPLPDIPPL